jgi:F-type H+-transporting ATPase subunit a
MDFNNNAYARIYITDSFWVNITDSLISIWIIGAVLITLAVVTRVKLKNFKPVPETRFQDIIEAMVDSFYGFIYGIMGKKYLYFGNWFFGLLAFVFLSNISGIFGMRPPTADLAVTFPLAFMTVILMQVIGLRHNFKEHLKDFARPVFIFIPMNLASDFSKSISLSLRLFGNIFGGLIIGGLVYGLLPRIVTIATPAVLSLYFDIFVGMLHALIFTMLSMYFMMMKAPAEE